MTNYNVTIDDNTMINILIDRVAFWVKEYEPAYSVYEGFITSLVGSGVFEGSEFDPGFVDNLYINDTSFYDSLEDALADGYTEDNIAYQSDDGVIVWVR